MAPIFFPDSDFYCCFSVSRPVFSKAKAHEPEMGRKSVGGQGRLIGPSLFHPPPPSTTLSPLPIGPSWPSPSNPFPALLEPPHSHPVSCPFFPSNRPQQKRQSRNAIPPRPMTLPSAGSSLCASPQLVCTFRIRTSAVLPMITHPGTPSDLAPVGQPPEPRVETPHCVMEQARRGEGLKMQIPFRLAKKVRRGKEAVSFSPFGKNCSPSVTDLANCFRFVTCLFCLFPNLFLLEEEEQEK